MKYKVRLTPQATEQIQQTLDYISIVLLQPDVSQRWAERLYSEMAELDAMPLRFPLVDEERWRSVGLRKMPVGNFLVYYFVEENSETVWITSVIYGRRDQIAALLNTSFDKLEA